MADTNREWKSEANDLTIANDPRFSKELKALSKEYSKVLTEIWANLEAGDYDYPGDITAHFNYLQKAADELQTKSNLEVVMDIDDLEATIEAIDLLMKRVNRAVRKTRKSLVQLNSIIKEYCPVRV